MIRKKDLRRKILLQEVRIRELEERICPIQSHDWIKVDYGFTGGTGCGDEVTLYTYQCRACGKIIKTYKIREVPNNGT